MLEKKKKRYYYDFIRLIGRNAVVEEQESNGSCNGSSVYFNKRK